MKRFLDGSAYLVAAVGLIWTHMPQIAALCAAVYACIQIWESKSVTAWRQRRESKRRVLRKLVAEREEARRLHNEQLASRRLRGEDA